MMDVAEAGPVVLFDGVCNLCAGTVQVLLRLDKRKVLKFASLQSEFGQSVISRHELAGVDSIVFVVGETVTVESDAALAIAGRLGWPYQALIVGRVMPRFIRDRLYRFIARNRIRWFGQRDSCLMPTPELRARFVD
jgi:predicted DCC family thiol-disulfide oxidoreductase YuxK